MNDAAAAGLTLQAPAIGLTPGTATGQSAIDGPGLIFVMSVVAGLAEGRSGLGLAFNAQIASQLANSSQAFATPSGNIAFNPTSPAPTLLAHRLGDLLTQTARSSPGNGLPSNGYVPVGTNLYGRAGGGLPFAGEQVGPSPLGQSSSGGHPISVSTAHAALPGAPSNPGLAPGTTHSPAAPLSQAISAQANSASPANSTPLPTTTVPAGPAPTAGTVPVMTETLVAAAMVLPYGAGQPAGEAPRAHERRVMQRDRRVAAAPVEDDGAFEGAARFTVALPDGIYAIDDESGLTVGVQDRNGAAVIVGIAENGRIVRIGLREFLREGRLGMLLLQERFFDLRMRAAGERRVECGWPAALPEHFRQARFRFDRTLPVTDPQGALRAFAEHDMRIRRGGLTIAPTLLRDGDTGLLAITGFSMILARRSREGTECRWRSFDIEGRPLASASHGAAVEEQVAALDDRWPGE